LPLSRRSVPSGGASSGGFNVPKRELAFVVLFLICGGLINYR
jgi:hypothetical protein